MILGLVERRPRLSKGFVRPKNELSDLSRESHRAHCPFAGDNFDNLQEYRNTSVQLAKSGFHSLAHRVKKVRSVVCALLQLPGNTA
jgi:hypothetical protein